MKGQDPPCNFLLNAASCSQHPRLCRWSESLLDSTKIIILINLCIFYCNASHLPLFSSKNMYTEQRMCMPKEIKHCSMFFDADECTSNAKLVFYSFTFIIVSFKLQIKYSLFYSCKWHKNARTCHGAAETLSCHRIHLEPACAATHGCAFVYLCLK